MYNLIGVISWCGPIKNNIIRRNLFHLKETAHTAQPVNHFGGVKKSTDLSLLRSLKNFSLLNFFKIDIFRPK